MINFCCGCSRPSKVLPLMPSPTFPRNEKIQLCAKCISKEKILVKGGWRDSVRTLAELLAWYEAPKFRQVKQMIQLLHTEESADKEHITNIVAERLGFSNIFALMHEVAKHNSPFIKHNEGDEVVKIMAEDEMLIDIQLQVMNLDRLMEDAQSRCIGVAETSSGNLRSRMGIIGSYSTPINRVAARVAFSKSKP